MVQPERLKIWVNIAKIIPLNLKSFLPDTTFKDNIQKHCSKIVENKVVAIYALQTFFTSSYQQVGELKSYRTSWIMFTTTTVRKTF